MTSKWNGHPCDLCGQGALHDGIKTITQQYKGQTFTSESRGAFCDHCNDGILEYDEAEELAWIAFRDQVEEGLKEADDPNTKWVSNEDANKSWAKQRAELIERAGSASICKEG